MKVPAVWLLAGLAALHGMPIQADPIHGRWQVRSYTSTTMTLDGKQKIKGPFAEQPASMFLMIGQRTYVSDEAGKRIIYAIRRSGRNYLLSRRADDGPVTIRLSGIRTKGNELRFTSTRINRPRQERYVVQWVCVASPMRAPTTASLVGTRWQLVEIAYNDDRVVRPEPNDVMTLEFPEAGRVVGAAALNRFTGSCTIGADRSLSFGPFAMTRAAVPPGSIADTYIKDLTSAKRYLLDKGMLVLELPYDTGVMKFRKQ